MLTNLNPILLVALGGAMGAVMRYLVMGKGMQFLGLTTAATGFPYGTLTVNILGSFLMGMLVGILARFVDGGEALRLLLAVGFLGGFTTFSAFSLDVLTLLERGDIVSASTYMFASVFLSILGIFLGVWVVRLLG